MRINPLTRQLLEQVAIQLDTAQGELALVNLNLAGRLAAYEAGPEFEAHPHFEDIKVRAWPRPKGAHYQVLEFKSLAGAKTGPISQPHASTVHVIQGSLLIRRHDQDDRLELAQTSDTLQFRRNEQHGATVLTNTHSLVIYSTK